jgi:hypothetical protein
MPAVGSTWRPTTSNVAERFLGTFDRFYRAKGPFQHPASAQKHVALFMFERGFRSRVSSFLKTYQLRGCNGSWCKAALA